MTDPSADAPPLLDRELTEAIRQVLEEGIQSPKVIRRYMRQVARDGRRDLLARVLRSRSRVREPALEAMLGAPTALTVNELHRRAAVGLALALADPRLLARFIAYFEARYEEDAANLERLRAQMAEEELYARLADLPDAEALALAIGRDPEGWFVGLLRRAATRKFPPPLLERLAPLGFAPDLATWSWALMEALGAGAEEVRPAVAAWVRAEAASRGWVEELLEWLVAQVTQGSPAGSRAAALLAAAAWRPASQELVFDRLAHGRWLLDAGGRAALARLGVPASAVRALEAYAEHAGRRAREEAAQEMTERFRRETEKRAERLLGPLHRIWAELALAAPGADPGRRHHFARMREAIAEMMAEMGVEPFGEPGEQVPYRLAIHRYIGHDAPPVPEAPVKVVEPGLRQPSEGGRFRIVRKALVT